MKNKCLKLTPSMILKRGHYLYFACYWIYEKIVDYRISKKNLSTTIFNDAPEAFPVQSISYPYIHQLEKHLEFSDNDVFVDVGCAWGRLLGYIDSKFEIKKLIGVELNDDVAKQAKKIFETNNNIEIISGNIIENLPNEATVFYLFNPFDATVLRKFICEIEKRIKHEIKILYLHPEYEREFERENWMLIESHRLMPKHLGSIKLNIYKYVPRDLMDKKAEK